MALSSKIATLNPKNLSSNKLHNQFEVSILRNFFLSQISTLHGDHLSLNIIGPRRLEELCAPLHLHNVEETNVGQMLK